MVNKFIKIGKRFFLLWESPFWAAYFAFAAYAIFAIKHGSLFGFTLSPYYNYLADAFLHGQLNLRLLPPSTHDLVLYHGNYYLYWPPFPALLLMPLVALFGVHISDIFLTVLIGAIDIGLLALLFRQLTVRGILSISPIHRASLVLLTALGSVVVTLAPFGRVWFLGQLVGFGCVLLAYLAAVSLQGWAAFLGSGFFIAAAVLTRNNLVFTGIWPLAFLWMKSKSEPPFQVLGKIFLMGLPVALAVGSLALYNWARFGSLTNVGLDYHQMAGIFVSDYHKYGPFSLHYVPTNLFYQYINYPFPIRSDTLMGGSLFLLSPLLFGALWVIKDHTGLPGWSLIALIASIFLTNIPILLLMGTGWVQFGPRYTLDFMVPLLILTATGIKKWNSLLIVELLVISVVQYLAGTIMMLNVY